MCIIERQVIFDKLLAQITHVRTQVCKSTYYSNNFKFMIIKANKTN